ncbi:NUDIX domain-containing protein [Halobacteriaceae archaeon GCM10025711]
MVVAVEALSMTDVRALAADGVVLVDGKLLLMERNHPPFEGHWVLPGGLVERDETAREACAREVEEEVGLAVEPVSFVGLYDDPGRDERGTVSAAFLCEPLDDGDPEAREEARQVGLFDLDSLPAMGFDHERIVADALDR